MLHLKKKKIRDGHLINITNKQAVKDRQCPPLDRYGFKICEKLTHCAGAKNICGIMWLFLKSTHLVHPCTSHHSDTPMENSGTPWGVRHTRLTSTDLEPLVTKTKAYTLPNDVTTPTKIDPIGKKPDVVPPIAHNGLKNLSADLLLNLK